MPWVRHRIPLITAALLDSLGLVLLAVANKGINTHVAINQSGALITLVLIYCSLGWLFGSYTLLKLKTITWNQMLSRLGTTTLASIAATTLISYLLRLQITNYLFFRSSIIPLFLLLSLWSALIRVSIYNLNKPKKDKERWHILALPWEVPFITREWGRGSITTRSLPKIIEVTKKTKSSELSYAEFVAFSSGVTKDPSLQGFCQEAVNSGQSVFSLMELAEQELQRIPTRWIENEWLLFSTSIDGQRTSPKKQLKRYADVLISTILLLISLPFTLIALALVKLYDGGNMIYRQKRSGLLGEPFYVLKIRTMSPSSEPDGAQWAQAHDERITPVGFWLRRTRFDEIPQLINVIRGEMSLIGPRPERPDVEKILEEKIPNYKLRHWMRPGLSGWAQVNMPYASSVEDSELKLSYDLFYLRNASFWLDFLILFKTIKIVLKASGR